MQTERKQFDEKFVKSSKSLVNIDVTKIQALRYKGCKLICWRQIIEWE